MFSRKSNFFLDVSHEFLEVLRSEHLDLQFDFSAEIFLNLRTACIVVDSFFEINKEIFNWARMGNIRRIAFFGQERDPILALDIK